MTAICDRDCLHCIHPDCINDEPPDDKERQELDRIDRELCPRTAGAQRQRARYHSDPEYRARVLAKSKARAQQHPEYIAEYRRRYNAAHREELNAKQRERYRRKKAERGGATC